MKIGSTPLACRYDDDLLLTGGDRPRSEQEGDEERKNRDRKGGEGLHRWGAKEGGWELVEEERAVINGEDRARKTATAPVRRIMFAPNGAESHLKNAERWSGCDSW